MSTPAVTASNRPPAASGVDPLASILVTPDHVDWDDARLAWNLAVDQRPAAVALPRSAEEVAAVVAFARGRGLRIAPQGTGHNAGPLVGLGDAVLLKTSRMRGVTIDVERRTARVEAGALWLDVTTAAGQHGLAALAGSSPDVGVVGYCLGGGVSWLGRRYGLACNSVTALELVTADGRLLRATAEEEPDLFWAVRGGGGSFGVVTAVELTLYPVAEVYAGVLFFPWERADEVLRTWHAWTSSVPETVTSCGRLLQLPPMPEVPEILRGRQFALVEVVVLGDAAEGAALVEPLRALGPEIDTLATIPAAALGYLHMDPEHPVPGIGGGALLRELSGDAIEALLEVAGPGSGSSLLTVEVRHLGGALGRAADGAGALAALAGDFMMFAGGVPADAASAAAVSADLAALQGALAPWNAGRDYLNFVEEPADVRRFYAAETHDRLREVKRRYDPAELLLANHPIRPR